MVCPGIVTNVTNFGAFVDVGVHQDGLVHISALADRFVKDPHSVVKAGQVVRVKVIEVDLARKRVALSMRMGDEAAAPSARADAAPRTKAPGRPHEGGGASRERPRAAPAGAIADALARARRK
jgi:uncharacterized protein